MTLKINPWLATAIMAGILIMAFALFRGCRQSKIQVAATEKITHIADSALALLKESREHDDSTKKDYEARNELLEGQIELLANQKAASEDSLDKIVAQNKELITRHHLADYNDTATIVVPNAYVKDCEECFTNLDKTTKLSLKYKNDINNFDRKLKDQTDLFKNRFKQLESEKDSLYFKMNSLANEGKKETDKIKPQGRLYLSWAIVAGPWPKMAGAGFMYQTKYNMMYEANWLYGNQGHMVYASMKFPLSIKF